jgi:integrase
VYKNAATGYYEDDFRRRGIPRLHLSYGVTKKDEALRLAAAVRRLYASKDLEAIEALRAGTLSVGEIARLQAEGKPVRPPVAVAGPEAWPSVRVAVAQYLAWIDDNPKKTKGTHAAATSEIKRFLTWLGDDADRPLDAISTRRVTEYQGALLRGGAATNTVTSSLYRVGGLFRWHRDTELRDAQEGKRVPRQLHIPLDPDSISTAHTSRTRYLTEAEAERLLAACPGRALCPVALGLFAGLRIDEAMHLRPAFDIDLALNLITIQPQPAWRPKSGKRRFVPIAAPLRPVLEQHLARYASEDWLIPSPVDAARFQNKSAFTDVFRRVVKDAGLVVGRKDPNGVVFHTLRHTFASWLVARGVDLYTTSQLLGNSLIQVERTYAHLSPDFKLAAINKLAGVVAIPSTPSAGDPA